MTQRLRLAVLPFYLAWPSFLAWSAGFNFDQRGFTSFWVALFTLISGILCMTLP